MSAPKIVSPRVAPVNPGVNMMNQMGRQLMNEGLKSLFSNPSPNPPPKTPAQIEAEQAQQRQLRMQHEQEEAARRAQEETDHQALRSEMIRTGSGDADDSGLMRASASAPPPPMAEPPDHSIPPPDEDGIIRHSDSEKLDIPKKRTDAFDKGYEHASGCFSQNSNAACGAVSAEQVNECLADYRNGYKVGDKKRQLLMDEASRAGERAGLAGEPGGGSADTRANGPCRISWVEAYNRGYYQGKMARAKR